MRVSAGGSCEKKQTTYQESDPVQRCAFNEALSQVDPAKIVWLDECGLTTLPTRPYARAARGTVVYEPISGQREKRLSILAAYDGQTLRCPWYFGGCTDTRLFNLWLETELLPTLGTGYTLILDNATFHHAASTRDLVEAQGCHLLFLPPYSPDLNPIEHQWAHLKQILRASGDPTRPLAENLAEVLTLLSNPYLN